MGSYTAPIIAPGAFTDGTLFFQSPDLPNANHTLVITLTNGTQPNAYFFDYLDYTTSPLVSSSFISTSSATSSETSQPSSESIASIPSQSSSSIPTSSRVYRVTIESSPASSGAPQSSSASNSAAQSNTVSSGIVQSSSGNASPTPSQSISVSNTSSSPTRIGPIIGGALGGVVFLIAFATLLFTCLKKSKIEHPPSHIEQIPGEFSWS